MLVMQSDRGPSHQRFIQPFVGTPVRRPAQKLDEFVPSELDSFVAKPVANIRKMDQHQQDVVVCGGRQAKVLGAGYHQSSVYQTVGAGIMDRVFKLQRRLAGFRSGRYGC